jgi:hypothetical protein
MCIKIENQNCLYIGYENGQIVKYKNYQVLWQISKFTEPILTMDLVLQKGLILIGGVNDSVYGINSEVRIFF